MQDNYFLIGCQPQELAIKCNHEPPMPHRYNSTCQLHVERCDQSHTEKSWTVKLFFEQYGKREKAHFLLLWSTELAVYIFSYFHAWERDIYTKTSHAFPNKNNSFLYKEGKKKTVLFCFLPGVTNLTTQIQVVCWKDRTSEFNIKMQLKDWSYATTIFITYTVLKLITQVQTFK